MSASREARPTIRFVDEYCQLYEGLFPEVRSFEAFKLVYLGMVSEIKRKSLPAVAKAVGLDNQQNLHHFLSESPWSAHQLRQKRLELILKVVNGRALILLIDETGDCNAGKKYRLRQATIHRQCGQEGKRHCCCHSLWLSGWDDSPFDL
jgi:SRSO17 transposase